MRRLYLATLPKIFHDVFKSKVGFLNPSCKRFEVFEILGKLHADRLIDEVRDGSFRFQGLEAQCAVQLGIKIDGGSFLRCFHGSNLTL